MSVAMFVCLSLGAGLWTMVACHYVREFAIDAQLPAALHQIELDHPRARALEKGTRAEASAWHARTWITFPEYEALTASGIPPRQAGSFRAQVLVSTDERGSARPENARYADSDLFGMFGIPLAHGRAFTGDEQRARASVVVLGERLARRLFGDRDCVGRGLLIEGRSFQVLGVVDGDQPVHQEWDIVWNSADQDALYVPMSWARPLGAWPDRMITQAPLATAGDLWRSDNVFVSFWAELRTADQRERYARYIAERVRSRGAAPTLRDLATWRRAFPIPRADVFFYTALLAVGLIGAAFTTSRLLLAKGLARRGEVGVHRALGATRRAVFARQMLEATLIAIPAVGAGVVYALAVNAFFNRAVLENDIPVHMTMAALVMGCVPSLLAGLAAAAYPAWRLSRTTPALSTERA
ncbi:MAG TPA: ABC transporter permease [Polyangia bacterium]|nr:ABC transporter permease [Polyangia bacterium]